MQYDLTINQHNIKPHLDIERSIKEKKHGLFTFNIRVNQGNIEDFSVFETITIKDYTGVQWNGFRERGISYNTGKGSTEDGIR